MKIETPRDAAIAFLAACDRPDAGDYERDVVRLARLWMRILKSRHTTQGVVNHLLDELDVPKPPSYGLAWDNLRRTVRAWALSEGWLERGKRPSP